MNSARWQRYYYNSYLQNVQCYEYSWKPKNIKGKWTNCVNIKLIVQNHGFFFCHLPINIQVLWIHWSFTNMNFKSLHISQMIWCVSAWKCCLIFNHWVKNLYLWPAIVIRLFFHFVNNVKFCNKIVMFWYQYSFYGCNWTELKGLIIMIKSYSENL